jgi:hypothetical protein
MGFLKENSEYYEYLLFVRRALSKFGNHISRATEYLITQNENPDMQEEEPKPESKEEAQAAKAGGIKNLFMQLFRGSPNGPDEDEEPPADSSET